MKVGINANGGSAQTPVESTSLAKETLSKIFTSQSLRAGYIEKIGQTEAVGMLPHTSLVSPSLTSDVRKLSPVALFYLTMTYNRSGMPPVRKPATGYDLGGVLYFSTALIFFNCAVVLGQGSRKLMTAIIPGNKIHELGGSRVQNSLDGF